MQVPPPENRTCEECLNTIPLNLFRLNSSKCRYCQDGLVIPPMLIEKKMEEETNTNELKISHPPDDTNIPENIMPTNQQQNDVAQIDLTIDNI